MNDDDKMTIADDLLYIILNGDGLLEHVVVLERVVICRPAMHALASCLVRLGTKDKRPSFFRCNLGVDGIFKK